MSTESAPVRPRRPVRTATVVRTEAIALNMVRVVLTGESLREIAHLTLADHYVKLKFGDAMRAYTIRSFDRSANELALDFVVHGDQGLAGPWAAAAQPGDQVSFVGPGGDWKPAPDADVHLFVGDESAIPAIAVGLESLPQSARAVVFLEVASPTHHQEMPLTANTTITWVHRDDAGLSYGEALTAAVIAADFPAGVVEAFVHGNADMVKPLRRYLFKERGMDRSRVSISGYWRSGLTDEAWRAMKREFTAQMDAEESAT